MGCQIIYRAEIENLIMNILIATYNYYPYNWGGTEVYVKGLADFLKTSGNLVYIIAGMPSVAFEQHQIFFDDNGLKAIQYNFESIPIIGVKLKEQNLSTIILYEKYKKSWSISWTELLKKLPVNHWDIIHLHAHSPLINTALIQGAKKYSPSAKVVFSYHTAISCPKNKLLMGNDFTECNVRPEVNICSACILSEKANIPLAFLKHLTPLFPKIRNENFPTFIRLKYLISIFISSFKLLDKYVDQWHVFSKQVHNILLVNNIEYSKIKLLVHGVKEIFFSSEDFKISKNSALTIFLYAGRFEKIKGFYTLLKAWKSLKNSSDKQLWLVGEFQGETSDSANKKTAFSNRSDIKWFGKKSQDELASIMKQVHCTIIPSEVVEIGPLIFHEAIAAGSDVIASDVGGCRELALQYKSKSRMFETENAHSLKEKIIEFKYSGKIEEPQSQLQNYEAVIKSYNEVSRNYFF